MKGDEKVKHTPGPWHANPKADEESFFEDVSVLLHSGLAVAVAVHNGNIEPSAVMANARLIAAAPALLANGWDLAVAALQSARYANEPDFRDAVDAMLDTCRIARGEPTLAEAAISKAQA